MMDTVLASMLIAIGAFVLGGVMGAALVTGEVTKDCQEMNQVRFNKVVFDCKERSK